MSDKSDSKSAVIDESTQRMAFELYRESIGQRGIQVHPQQLAAEAFRNAVAFQKVSAQMKAGNLPLEVEAESSRQLVRVPRGRMRDDNQGFEALRDPATRAEVYEMVPEDPFAFAPNLPADHPINMRFKPRDGITFKDRVLAHRQAVMILVGPGANDN